jgi:hypothetical protein
MSTIVARWTYFFEKYSSWCLGQQASPIVARWAPSCYDGMHNFFIFLAFLVFSVFWFCLDAFFKSVILPKILQKILSSCIVIRHTLSMLKEKSVNHEVHRRGRVHNHLRSNNLSRLKSNHLRHLKNWHLRSIWQNFLSIFDDFTSLRCFNHEFKTN